MAKILVIDDDVQIRTLFRKVLEEAGHLVFDAANGREGLRQFRQTPTALVLTDLFMPEGDGLEVTMALHRECPSVKIIVFTGASYHTVMLGAAKRLGAHRTIDKLSTKAELLDAVEQELQ